MNFTNAVQFGIFNGSTLNLVLIDEHCLVRFYYGIREFCTEMEDDLVLVLEGIYHFAVDQFHPEH